MMDMVARLTLIALVRYTLHSCIRRGESSCRDAPARPACQVISEAICPGPAATAHADEYGMLN